MSAYDMVTAARGAAPSPVPAPIVADAACRKCGWLPTRRKDGSVYADVLRYPVLALGPKGFAHDGRFYEPVCKWCHDMAAASDDSALIGDAHT